MDYDEMKATSGHSGVGARAQRVEPIGEGPLDNIVYRIDRATLAAREIGNKLNDHADRVHGPSGTKTLSGGIERADTVRERPPGAMSRIFEALGNLEQAQSYLAEAAGRNSTLA